MDTKLFDHTILKADATREMVERVCREAREHHFMSVCVNSYYTGFVADELQGSDVRVCTVVGFPLGQMSTKAKAAETRIAVEDGADEIDMVINVGALKGGDDAVVFEDIRAVRKACEGKVLKVIIETCLLNEEEKVRACRLAMEAKADFVKTSTGFSTGGATFDDIQLFAKHVGEGVKIKAAGGISSMDDAEKFLTLGADRLGTSRIVKIVKKEEGAGY